MEDETAGGEEDMKQLFDILYGDRADAVLAQAKVFARMIPTDFAHAKAFARMIPTDFAHAKAFARMIPTDFAHAKAFARMISTDFARTKAFARMIPQYKSLIFRSLVINIL
jgi:hypothetical protein